MRALSLYVAMLGVIAWLVLSLGGVGGLMYVGSLSENVAGGDIDWIKASLWVLVPVLMVLWWGAVAVALLNRRTLLRWVGDLPNHFQLTLGEWCAIAGHVFLLIAGANAVLYPRVVESEFVYGFLLLAAVGYAAGIWRATLTARSTPTPCSGDAPLHGAG